MTTEERPVCPEGRTDPWDCWLHALSDDCEACRMASREDGALIEAERDDGPDPVVRPHVRFRDSLWPFRIAMASTAVGFLFVVGMLAYVAWRLIAYVGLF